MGEQRFKVGDRVRTIGGGDDGYIGVEGVIETDDGSTCSNLRVKLDKPIEKWGDTKIWRSAHHLEHVLLVPEQPATLKIEAGKFYKTRDGRKVGPIVVDREHDRRYGWTVMHKFSADYGKAWRADGTFHPDVGTTHGADLIAEWVVEPVAKPSNDNAQSKFKVGDLIRHKTLKYEGVVKEVVDQRTVRTHWTKEGWGATDPIDCIELITPPKPTTAIVALIENGQPKPSSTPHVHASTRAAEKEAKRLAAKYRGKQFGVFTLTTTHEEAAPVYDHKWQNMAALGLKIDAIK